MSSNGQQVIANDGDDGSYLGPVTSSTASTVTLAADPAWNWMGTTNPQAAVMAIVFGTGVGQYSFLQSYSGRTIHRLGPWKLLPDTTSIVVIAQYELNMTVAHNSHRHSGRVDCLRRQARRCNRRQPLDEFRAGNPDCSLWPVRRPGCVRPGHEHRCTSEYDHRGRRGSHCSRPGRLNLGNRH
jgi:hypothetical protein